MSSPTPRLRRLGLHVSALAVSLLFAKVAAATPADDWQSRVAPRLLALWAQSEPETGDKRQARGALASTGASTARFDQQGRVQLDVRFNCASPAPTKTLAAAGLLVGTVVRVAPLCSVEGWLQTADLPNLAARSAVRSIDLPTYSRIIGPVTDVAPQFSALAPDGSSAIDGNGITIMRVDQYIQTTGKNGAGVTIGVMSDDVTSLATIQARGELPAHISNVTPAQQAPNPQPTDEGTMLLEEMHAVAPGATLAFCAPQTDVEYVSCLRDLIAAGASIVADDIEYPAEDMMSTQSALAQGVQTLLAQNPNVMLFSAAGNENQSYWQGEYAPTLLTNPLTCSSNGQADLYGQLFNGNQFLTMTQSVKRTEPIYLQWADPFTNNTSKFDLYVLDRSFNVIKCLAGAAAHNSYVADLTHEFAKNTFHFAIATPGAEDQGKLLKLIAYANGAAIFSHPSGTPDISGSIASPQKLLSSVVTVGAVYGADGLGGNIEPFSATGPVLLEFPMPSTVQAPVLVAPDAVYIDLDGTKFRSTNSLFYGTSAATPNAAAVAALLRSTFPSLSAPRILGALTSGATPLGNDAAPDGVFGYGRVDAVGSLQTLAAPGISHISGISLAGGTSNAIAFTLTGTGTLVLKGSSDNSALLPFSAAAAQFSPTSCGNSTNACTLTLTPLAGKLGTAHLTVTVTDGAGRAASTSFTVTVTQPLPPTVHVTAGAAQSIQAGSTPAPVTVSLSGAKPVTVSITSSNTTLLPASAATLGTGCGSGSLSCTLTLRPVAGQLGSATVTVIARDAYGQSAQGTLTITVVAAAPKPDSSGGGGGGGGGGAFDVGSLAILALLLAKSLAPIRTRTAARGSD